jgi:hypothetical protein
MNAYELADQLDNVKYQNGAKPFGIYANMFRQQADRIGVLEANYKIQVNIVEKQQDYIDQLEQGLRASIELNKAQAERQTKPLSDEEIYALWCEADNTELLPEMRLKDGSINYIITTFAKLIEERHGIK